MTAGRPSLAANSARRNSPLAMPWSTTVCSSPKATIAIRTSWTQPKVVARSISGVQSISWQRLTLDGAAAHGPYPGLRGQALFKRVAGVAGDVITVQGREVFVNGQPVGRAKTHAFDRRELSPIAPTVIPAGHLYVQGTSADSFDSRYSLSGLVREQDVKSRVIPLL